MRLPRPDRAPGEREILPNTAIRLIETDNGYGRQLSYRR
jgi:hypothetical protein